MQITGWQWLINALPLTDTEYENWAETFLLLSTREMFKPISSVMEDSRKWAFVHCWWEKGPISKPLSSIIKDGSNMYIQECQLYHLLPLTLGIMNLKYFYEKLTNPYQGNIRHGSMPFKIECIVKTLILFK